ncbi:hypothetical protein [Nitrosomonas sp.]|uniref:hypothetical protein n=1 Tax=Nitrosomonas sp. TaxID=42353 RepID=UPI001D9719A2|nr:hypothetical protein [Nitrosomonas sp.]MCB1949640.1 hypothetical protein [Nitrosomonas sp.]
MEATLVEEHPFDAPQLINLVELYLEHVRCETAEPICQRAIRIMEKAFPDGHPNLDRIKVNYAKLKNKRSDEQGSE